MAPIDPAPPSNPVTAQMQQAWNRHFPYSASTTHPAFFTDRLRRSAVSAAPQQLNSPVTHGYIYQDGTRQASNAGNLPKL
ncbi:hypothetical protein V2A60_009322 [Cordyceps javanica]